MKISKQKNILHFLSKKKRLFSNVVALWKKSQKITLIKNEMFKSNNNARNANSIVTKENVDKRCISTDAEKLRKKIKAAIWLIKLKLLISIRPTAWLYSSNFNCCHVDRRRDRCANLSFDLMRGHSLQGEFVIWPLTQSVLIGNSP